VICKNDAQHITHILSLEFWGNRLIGTLPAALSQLTALTSVRLDHNDVTGLVPNLAFNNFTFCQLVGGYGNNSFACPLPKTCNASSITGGQRCQPGLCDGGFYLTCKDYACNGSSSGLAQPECNAWVELFDATGGANWTNCSKNRLDPCGCEVLGNWKNCDDSKKHIVALGMTGNNIVGSIPDSIGDFPHVSAIWFGHNHLTGTIPAALAQLANILQQMDLESNLLTGSIPSAIAQLTLLKLLGLNVNKLTSSIPAAFSQLSLLEHLDLSSNLLNGSIPADFTKLKKLKFLALEENMLTGIIPELLIFTTSHTGCFLAADWKPATNRYLCPLPQHVDNCAGAPTCTNYCTGNSAALTPSECSAWIDLFDTTGGSSWAVATSPTCPIVSQRLSLRTDPCGCTGSGNGNVQINCTGPSPKCGSSTATLLELFLHLSGNSLH
jgi:Leucine-rich repeat (LRR) protein